MNISNVILPIIWSNYKTYLKEFYRYIFLKRVILKVVHDIHKNNSSWSVFCMWEKVNNQKKANLMLKVFELIHDVWIQLHVLRKRGFQTPWINLKYINLSRSVWEILCSVSPHIVSGFFSFSIQIHRRITCNKFLHVPDCSCPVGWPDFSPGAGVPGYSVLIFGVGLFDVIHIYTGAMTYCQTI